MSAQRSAADATERLIDRLHSWSARSWAVPGRVAAVRSALQHLEDLGAAAAGRPTRPVPEAGVHALADQLAVLTHQAIECAADPRKVGAVVIDLAATLGFR